MVIRLRRGVSYDHLASSLMSNLSDALQEGVDHMVSHCRNTGSHSDMQTHALISRMRAIVTGLPAAAAAIAAVRFLSPGALE